MSETTIPPIAAPLPFPRWPVVGLVFLLLITPFAYGFATRQMVNVDPFVYGHTAKEVLAGKKLYADAWQDKPTLGIMAYAVPSLLGFRSYYALGVFQGIWLVAEALLFFVMFRRDFWAALGAALLTVVLPLTMWDYAWPSTEHFCNPFIAGLLLIAWTIERDRNCGFGRAAVIGILAICAFNVRQNTILAALVPLSAIYFLPLPIGRRILAGSVAAIAGLAGWALILLLTARIGDLHGYFYTVFIYPMRYAAAGSIWTLTKLLRDPLETFWPILFFLSAAICMTTRYRRLVVTSALIGIVICLLPRRSFDHYWANFFPFVALYIGIGLTRENIGRLEAQRAMICGIGLTMGLIACHYLAMVSRSPTYLAYESLAQLVDKVAPPGSTLFVSGPMADDTVLFNSSVPAANTYAISFQLEPPYPGMIPKPIAQVLDEYLKHPPGVIVTSRKELAEDEDPATATNTAYLIRSWMASAHWRPAANFGDLVILVRDNN